VSAFEDKEGRNDNINKKQLREMKLLDIMKRFCLQTRGVIRFPYMT